MGEMIQFLSAVGHKANGYYLKPGDRTKAPGVVIVHEYWGLRPEMKNFAQRLYALGYQAIVPDLFHGHVATNEKEAEKLMKGLDFGAALHEIGSAAEYVRKQGGAEKVAVLGFCMGGALTIASAVKVDHLDAAVCFYGIPPQDQIDPAQVRVPILLHYAQDDQWCTPEAVNKVEERLKAGNAKYELYRYPAKHAFMNDARPEVFNAEQAALAWQRTIHFLGSNLASTPVQPRT
jgi:carboxymethylenebutenolidase